LNLLEKRKKKWCEETSIIFIHAIKGSIKGLTLCFENNTEAITVEFVKNITLIHNISYNRYI
jgi:hypothetical protein